MTAQVSSKSKGYATYAEWGKQNNDNEPEPVEKSARIPLVSSVLICSTSPGAVWTTMTHCEASQHFSSDPEKQANSLSGGGINRRSEAPAREGRPLALLTHDGAGTDRGAGPQSPGHCDIRLPD